MATTIKKKDEEPFADLVVHVWNTTPISYGCDFDILHNRLLSSKRICWIHLLVSLPPCGLAHCVQPTALHYETDMRIPE